MKMITQKAYAKINLTLDVLAKRDDGYHEIESVMQTLTFCDEVKLMQNDSGELTTGSNLYYLPNDERNNAIVAAKVFYKELSVTPQGVHIQIRKCIPTNSGLGGGSADAAAVLRGLNIMHGNQLSIDELVTLAEQIGSDVPFCIRGGTQLARGRGETLTPLTPMPFCWVVLCKTGRKDSTGNMFARLEEIRDIECTTPYNNKFTALLPIAKLAIEKLIKHGATTASLTGSGPTVFGLFHDMNKAYAAARAMQRGYKEIYVTTIKEKIR